jgi:hypothetical protein
VLLVLALKLASTEEQFALIYEQLTGLDDVEIHVGLRALPRRAGRPRALDAPTHICETTSRRIQPTSSGLLPAGAVGDNGDEKHDPSPAIRAAWSFENFDVDTC